MKQRTYLMRLNTARRSEKIDLTEKNTPGDKRRKKLEIRIKDEFIKLGQALKLAGVVEDGVEAKYAINDGLVLVNGEVENRRGRKIHPGDTISYDGKDIYVIG